MSISVATCGTLAATRSKMPSRNRRHTSNMHGANLQSAAALYVPLQLYPEAKPQNFTPPPLRDQRKAQPAAATKARTKTNLHESVRIAWLFLHSRAFCGSTEQIRSSAARTVAKSPRMWHSRSEMCNALETKPPEIEALIEALLPRRSFFALKARLLRGVRLELKAARDSGLTWLAIWTALRGAGYLGSYQQFCKAAGELVENRQPRPRKKTENLLASAERKEGHSTAPQVGEVRSNTKEKPEWQRRREEAMARLDREAEANLEKEERSSKPKKFTMTPFVGRGQE